MDIREREERLLRLLRHRARCTADGLAAELGVSRRTVLRDLQRLRDRGFDISSMTGPGGGVRLEPTSVMITSQLKGREVVALLLAVAIASASPGIPFLAAADTAIAKIEASLPKARADELQRFMHRVMIDPPQGTAGATSGPVVAGLVDEFEKAFTANRMLEFAYTDRAGRRTKRSVEPHGLLVTWPNWYVIAWDPQPDATRLFRADRIEKPRMAEQEFIPRPHDLIMRPHPNAFSARAVPRQ
ncbi:MAG: WYL domain-containing protein [Actinomycetia bacterium]|nr:WYL domain-containing protein [Actinomycetes bacterium]